MKCVKNSCVLLSTLIEPVINLVENGFTNVRVGEV